MSNGTGKSLPSAKTVRLSATPSPSVSSRMTMRSRGILPLAVRLGYSKHSTTQTRPFSSTVIAIGLTTSGSAANSFISKPSAVFMRATDSSGLRYGWPDGLRLSKPCSFCARAEAAQTNNRRTARERRDMDSSRRDGEGNGVMLGDDGRDHNLFDDRLD